VSAYSPALGMSPFITFDVYFGGIATVPSLYQLWQASGGLMYPTASQEAYPPIDLMLVMAIEATPLPVGDSLSYLPNCAALPPPP
jgi:hypothetical protein